jgi:hypothetical protein
VRADRSGLCAPWSSSFGRRAITAFAQAREEAKFKVVRSVALKPRFGEPSGRPAGVCGGVGLAAGLHLGHAGLQLVEGDLAVAVGVGLGEALFLAAGGDPLGLVDAAVGVLVPGLVDLLRATASGPGPSRRRGRRPKRSGRGRRSCGACGSFGGASLWRHQRGMLRLYCGDGRDLRALNGPRLLAAAIDSDTFVQPPTEDIANRGSVCGDAQCAHVGVDRRPAAPRRS